MQYTVYTYHMNMRVGPISMYVAMCIHIYILHIYIYVTYIYITYIYYICNIYYIYIYIYVNFQQCEHHLPRGPTIRRNLQGTLFARGENMPARRSAQGCTC